MEDLWGLDFIFEEMYEQICGSGLYNDAKEILSQNLFSSTGKYASMLDLVNLVYDAVMTVALMLVFIYFILAMVEKLSSETFTWEHFIKQLALLLVSKFVLENGMVIIEYCFDLGLGLFNEITAVLDNQEAFQNSSLFETNTSYDAFKDLMGVGDGSVVGFIKQLFLPLIMLIVLILPWLISFIGELLMKLVMYSRVIDIYLRAMAAPIAFADFYHGGLQSAGFRYLKNFLAVGIQGALIMMIVAIYSLLVATVVPTGFDSLATFFGFWGIYASVMAAAVMLMFKSMSLAKEIVGVG